MKLEDIKIPDDGLHWPASASLDINNIVKAILHRELKIADLKLPFPKNKRKGPEIFVPPNVRKRAPIIRISEGEYDEEREYFWTLGFDENGHLAFIDLIEIGGKWRTKVKVKDIFRGFSYYEASQAVFAHNHPGEKADELSFSLADITTTQKLIQAGILLDVLVRNHILLNNKDGSASLVEQGLMYDMTIKAVLKDGGEEMMAKIIKDQKHTITLTSKENVKLKQSVNEQDYMLNKAVEELENRNKVISLKDERISQLEEQLAKLKKD
ncbi:MAG: hypothetical protein FWE37_06035 [Spirochaetaceae bacterium]|nr:hypothetical protein [Spirochaetaceae bacterium]